MATSIYVISFWVTVSPQLFGLNLCSAAQSLVDLGYPKNSVDSESIRSFILHFAEWSQVFPAKMVKPDVPNGTHTANGPSSISAIDGAFMDPEGSIVSRAKKAFKVWYDLQDAAKEMVKYSEDLGKVEEVLDRHRGMEDATRSRDSRIATLESANQVSLDTYDKRYKAWEGEKSQLESKVKKLETDVAARARMTEKQKAAHAQSVAQMKKDLDTEKRTVAKLTKELEIANKKTQDTNTKLGRCNEQLKEWEGNLSLLKEVDFKVLSVRFSYCDAHAGEILTCYVQ